MNMNNEEVRKQKKRKLLIVIGIVLVIAIVATTRILFHVLETPLRFSDDRLVFIFIINIVNIILLIALGLLIFRNLIKLYFERRRNILGSKLKVSCSYLLVLLLHLNN